MPVQALLREGAQRLAAAELETPRLDCEVLLGHFLALPRLALLSDDQRLVDPEIAAAFYAAVERRKQREPVAYIVGTAEFWSLSLKVTRDVLIPRPDSEILVEAALDCLPSGEVQHIVDLGTGSGCLSLAILTERKYAKAVAIDSSAKAAAIAAENAAALGLENRFDVRTLPMQAWLAGSEIVDMIISNPPYISLPDYQGLAADVRDFEPESALLGGADGLVFYRMIAQHALQHLRPGGSVIVEIGYDQAEAVAGLFAPQFSDITCQQDLAGRDRVIIARTKIE